MSTFSTRQPEKVAMGFREAQIPHGATAVPVMVQNVGVVGVGTPVTGGGGGIQNRVAEIVMCNTIKSMGGRWQHLSEVPLVGDGGNLSNVNEVELAPGVQLPANGTYTVLGKASANGSCKLVVHQFVPSGEQLTTAAAKNRIAQLATANA